MKKKRKICEGEQPSKPEVEKVYIIEPDTRPIPVEFPEMVPLIVTEPKREIQWPRVG